MKEYDTIEEEQNGVSEPDVQYGSVSGHHEGIMPSICKPRMVSDEEIANCYTLEEFKKSMDEMIESTHNHDTGCVGITPIVPRKCSINDVIQRSMTIEQFTTKLYATVDKFYGSKA
jgi:hypothetical protein